MNRIEAAKTISTIRQQLVVLEKTLAQPYETKMVFVRALEAICSAFDVPPEKIKSSLRTNDAAFARFGLMWILRNHEKMTLQQIATHLTRDHATVMHGVKAASEMILSDRKFAKKMHHALTELGIETGITKIN